VPIGDPEVAETTTSVTVSKLGRSVASAQKSAVRDVDSTFWLALVTRAEQVDRNSGQARAQDSGVRWGGGVVSQSD
jgi:hypothetical protein